MRYLEEDHHSMFEGVEKAVGGVESGGRTAGKGRISECLWYNKHTDIQLMHT